MIFRNYVTRSPRRFEAHARVVLRSFAAAVLSLCAFPLALVAQSQSFEGMIAKRETASLSYEDKLAAYDAEQAVLSSEWGTQGYNWKGPGGAYGTIIASGSIPQPNSGGFCRRFIHIVHHKDDAGANPTYYGMACRSGDAAWKADR